VSHVLPLDEAPAAYQKFDQRVDGYTKVILRPQDNVFGGEVDDDPHR